MAGFAFEEIKKILHSNRVEQVGPHRIFKNVIIDSRIASRGSLFIAIRGVNDDGHDFIEDAVARGARCLIIQKKMRKTWSSEITVIRVPDTTHALGELARAHRQRFDIPVIAVTGSAGKTTTKDMIADVLRRKYHVLKNRRSFNNQWGVPLTLLELTRRHQVAVVEAGTNHPGEMAYLSKIICPTIAVLTNIGPSHLEGFHSVDNVYCEKCTLIKALVDGGTVVFNEDDPFLKRLRRIHRAQYSFGLGKNADLTASQISLDKKGRLLFKMNGRYPVIMNTPVQENVMNALAAAACARLLGMTFIEICSGLQKVRFQDNRQHVERIGGVVIINDSYNANPVSFRSALNTLRTLPARGKRILVCGDMLELGKDTVPLHREMGVLAIDAGIDKIFTFGPLMKYFRQEALRADSAACMTHYDHLHRLNRSLKKSIKAGDVVLVKGSRGMHMERVVQFLKGHVK